MDPRQFFQSVDEQGYESKAPALWGLEIDWRKRRIQLDQLASNAREREDYAGSLVYDSLAVMAEQLDHLQRTVSHVEEGLAVLTTDFVALESRIHENGE